MRGIWKSVLFLLALLFLLNPLGVVAATLPPAQREEAERFLFLGYDLLTRQRYWDALDALEKALSRNTYLVDYYLMRSLAERRLGDLEGAAKSLGFYLEVRPREDVPARMLEAVRLEIRYFEDALRGLGRMPFLLVEGVPFGPFFGLPLPEPFGVLGMGQPEALGGTLLVPDTLGSRVFAYRKGGRAGLPLSVDAPVSVMARDRERFLVVGRKGLVEEGRLVSGDLSGDLTLLGPLDAIPADAVLAAENQMVVADWGGRNVRLVELPFLHELWRWRPESGDKIFEPVGLGVLGHNAAVADRGGSAVFILDLARRDVVARIPVPHPRDVLWMEWGLLVLGEEGELGLWRPDRGYEVLAEGLRDGWSLTLFQGEVLCLGVDGRRLWRIRAIPETESASAMMTLLTPGTTASDDIVMTARIAQPLLSAAEKEKAFCSGIWMGKRLEGVPRRSIVKEKAMPLALLAPGAPPVDMPTALLPDGGVWRDVLRHVCRGWRSMPTDILVDARIPFGEKDLESLAAFSFHNGVRVSVWGLRVPSALLMRVSRMTGGVFFASAAPVFDETLDRLTLEMSFPLPDDALPSGYPSQAMFAAYLDLGGYSLRDWFPFWPYGLKTGAMPIGAP